MEWIIPAKTQMIQGIPTGKLNDLDKRVKYLETHGASPAGSNKQIQYNNNGVFGASADLTFEPALLTYNGFNPIFYIHDDGNQALAEISNRGGEFNFTISDDFTPTIISVMHLQVGGNSEYGVSTGGTGLHGHVFTIESDIIFELKGDKSTNVNFGLLATGKAAVTGTGTVTSSGTTLNGSSTLFLSQVQVGDYLTVPDEGSTAIVVSITNDTTLTTDVELTSYGEAFTIQHPIISAYTDASVNRFYVNPVGTSRFTQTDGVTNLTLKGGGGNQSFFGDNGQLVCEDLDGNHIATFGDAFWITKRYGILTLSGDSSDTGAGYTRIFEIDGIDRQGTGGGDKRAFTWQVAQSDANPQKFFFSMFTRITATTTTVPVFGSTWDQNVYVNHESLNNAAAGVNISGAVTGDKFQVNGNSYLGGNANVKTNVSIGAGNSPTARLHIAAGTASASTAPIKLTSGTSLTTPESGTIEFDGTDFYFTI